VRPRIVDYLTGLTHFEGINYIIPTGLTIYLLTILVIGLVFITRAQRAGLSDKYVLRVTIIATVSGILGVRIFSILEHMIVLGTNTSSWFSVSGSTTSWGAYIFAPLAFFLYLAYHRQPVLQYADILGATIGLGPFIGRWACFFNGCCYGKITDLFWAVRFPQYSPAYNAHWKAGLIDLDTPLSLPVHPFQLYASLAALIIFIVASKLYARYADKPGITLASYGFLYGLIRFFIEFYRDDVPRHTGLEWTVGQWMCLILIILSAVGLWFLQKRYRMPNDTGSTRTS
jgi:phosphatidylglycerol:prolipoprotein diacylglycerol transferase